MTPVRWQAFSDFRDRFRSQCDRWLEEAGGTAGWLAQAQRAAVEADGGPTYPLHTPVVYNRALDDIGPDGDIALLVVGDNPGKDEQLERNRRYLVGQAGKLGEGFFRAHPELGIDFRRNVLILNKTPVHTAKTKQLARVAREAGERATRLLDESQGWMARETAALQRALGAGLWLVGYGELKGGGLFARYAETLAGAYGRAADAPVRVYQHFSMNRFSIDLRERDDPRKSLAENLDAIGLAHRREILGW